MIQWNIDRNFWVTLYFLKARHCPIYYRVLQGLIYNDLCFAVALILIDLNLSQALKLILFVFPSPTSVTYFSPSSLYWYFLSYVFSFIFLSTTYTRNSHLSIFCRCKSSLTIKLEWRPFVEFSVAGSKRKKNEETIRAGQRWKEFDLEARSKSKLFTVRFVVG